MTRKLCETCGNPLPANATVRRRFCCDNCRKHPKLNLCLVCGLRTGGRYCPAHAMAILQGGRRAVRDLRDTVILQMREDGCLNYEIAAKLKTTDLAISSAVHRMRQRGIDVPVTSYDPHRWNAKGNKEIQRAEAHP